MVSGSETVKCLCKSFGGEVVHQKGILDLSEISMAEFYDKV